MGYLTLSEMFDNMLQLMRFSVYFERVLNTNNGYFNIKIMISAAHMLGGTFPPRKFGKKCFLVHFDVSLRTIDTSHRSVFSHAICGPTQGPVS